jgi:hypothetical protein
LGYTSINGRPMQQAPVQVIPCKLFPSRRQKKDDAKQDKRRSSSSKPLMDTQNSSEHCSGSKDAGQGGFPGLARGSDSLQGGDGVDDVDSVEDSDDERLEQRPEDQAAHGHEDVEQELMQGGLPRCMCSVLTTTLSIGIMQVASPEEESSLWTILCELGKHCSSMGDVSADIFPAGR